MDLDGDGHLDLAVADLGKGELAVFLQGSAGAFSPAPELRLSSLQRPLGLVAGDIDGDGRADLAAADALGNRLVLFLQVNTRSFPDSPDLVLGNPKILNLATWVEAADLNDDGLLDLAIASRTNGSAPYDFVSIFFQKSPGHFAKEPDIRLSMSSVLASGWMLAMDLDGDGKVDLAVPDGNSTVLVYFQAQLGVFPDRPDLELQIDVPGKVLAADLNGDGRLDLAIPGISELSFFLQGSNRQFLRFDPPLVLTQPGFGVWDLAVTDLNGDGRLDMAALMAGSLDLIRIFFQKPEGGFPLIPDSNLGSRQDPPFTAGMTASDLDGDSFQDLITRGNTSGLLLFFQEKGKGFADAQGSLLDDAEGGTMKDSVGGWAADFDGDRRLDLVSANNKSETLTIFYQRMPRVFGSTRNLVAGVIPDRVLGDVVRPVNVLAIDLDGDGDPDLVVSDYDVGNINIYFGNH